MNTYGILGYPLGHSFSKKYFEEKFDQLQVEAEFLNFELPSIQELPKTLKEKTELKGFCVTIPYKEEVIPFLDEIDPLAEKLGAVNSVQIIKNGEHTRLKGFNTDIYGFQESLKEFIGEKRPKALILGTGGASKAIAGGLEDLGIEYRFVSRKAQPNQFTYDQLTKEIIQYFKLIINCSPLGTFPKEDTCPCIPYKHLGEKHFLYDLVYNPAETLFMKKGAEQGAKTHNGLKMLHLQAEKNWEIWNAK
ncbi:shikimate dehydrogenase family protein [Marinifilum caeruleilacunae]|uniref:Shikimate dehydrogenase n=1 Tax=Marinifilum caeruleilacunae TaxID=2499076 RepID=A0ABX1WSX0_9BACT|nr:shikimate dehydrogenase [Marinifilum caeruleilacunae]NOU59202.1 shikimate dehydrogenase [Marinifilum caeruleilacunae]